VAEPVVIVRPIRPQEAVAVQVAGSRDLRF
jgi:hypothetical protein